MIASLLAFTTIPPAQAAQSYDNCTGFIDSVPATISTQGVWCLRADLSTAITNGNAITIATNNVTIECNDFKLGGLAAGVDTQAAGIYALSRLNAVVRNCNIRGFKNGVWFSSGGGHVVENSRFDGNTWIGIRLNAANSTLRGNLLVDTGGTTNSTHAYGIVLGDGEGGDVVDNTIIGVAPAVSSQTAYGIWIGLMSDGSVRNNRVRGLFAPTGTAFGIYGFGDHSVVMEGNILHGPTSGNSTGIFCQSTDGTAVRNTLRRFTTGISGCTTLGNLIN